MISYHSPLTYSPLTLAQAILGDAVFSLSPIGEAQERQAQTRQGQRGRLWSGVAATATTTTTAAATTAATTAAARTRRNVHVSADAARVGATRRSGRRIAGHRHHEPDRRGAAGEIAAEPRNTGQRKLRPG